MKMKPTAPLLLCLLMLLIPAGANAQETPLEPVKLQLQWKYQFQFAGFIMARELGYYREAGLDVEILEYDNSPLIDDLESGKIDYAVSNSVLAYKKGRLRDITLLATYFQRSPLILITQPEIESILDLQGKRVMMSHNNRHNSSISILLDYFDLNDPNKIEFIEPSFSIEEFINRDVDAITAFRSNEIFELQQRGVDFNVIDPVEHGFSTNAINLFTSHDKIETNLAQVKGFIQATRKGWQYALDNIEQVARLIQRKYRPEKSVDLLIFEGEVTRDLMLADLFEIGEINTNFVNKTFEQLKRKGMILADASADRLYYLNPGGNKQGVPLSAAERAWIHANPVIRFTGDPNWLPYEAFSETGEYIGMVSDHLKLIEQQTGLSFDPIPVSSWSESLEIATRGEVSMISGDAADAVLNRDFRPVDTYSRNPIVIVMHHREPFVDDLETLADRPIAIIRDYGYTADIFNTYPGIDFIEVENIQEGLIGVSQGRFDAMLATMALASYHIAEMGMHNLRIVGKTPIIMDLTLFVHADLPVLHSIINKTLHSIDQATRQDIYRNWIRTQYVEKTDYTVAVVVAIALISILLVTFASNQKMQREIQRRIASENQLKATQKSLTAAQHIANLGSWEHDIANDRFSWSAEVYRIAEVKEQRFTLNQERILSLIHPSDRKQVQKHYLESLRSQTPCDFNLRLLMPDKRVKHVNLRGKTTYASDGTPLIMTGTVHDITLQMEQEQRILTQAHYDALTSLPNRTLLADRMSLAMKEARRHGTKIAIAFLDLDGFKEINDTYGHETGDSILITLARRMQDSLRNEDTIARVGGDEFVILFKDLHDIKACTILLNRLLKATSNPLHLHNREFLLSASIGVTFYPQKIETIEADQLVRQADQAMYQAKLTGKNRFHLFDTVEDTEVRNYYEYIESVKEALDKNQFLTHYQPIVNMRSGEVVGLEALVRWQHPHQGLLSPSSFLSSIDNHPLIIDLGNRIIDTVLTELRYLTDHSLRIPVSINVSARQLEHEPFIDDLVAKLKQEKLPNRLIQIEVLETSALQDIHKTGSVIGKCKQAGIQIALDDFGTGYSSLRYLKHLPADKLKIDQTFVRDMQDDPEDLAILDGIIGLARAFNREVIAEGVESISHGRILLQFGCQLAQGYAIARPMPVDEIPEWITQWSPPESWREQVSQDPSIRPAIYAMTEHRAWIKTLSEHINSQTNPTPPLDYMTCNFGKWLQSEAAAPYVANPLMRDIEELHRQIHHHAAEIMSLRVQGNSSGAIAGLEQLYLMRDNLIGHLNRVVTETSGV